jgi:tripartite-type tricarboxylate transporter receptor subunit TctC
MKQETIIMWMFIVIFALCILIFPNGTKAGPYYEGKAIKMIVGFSPGGGYDRMTRLLAKYLPKYIPGKPAIIVENMTGASSIIAANYLALFLNCQ